MKRLALAIPILLLYGCGGGNSSPSHADETTSTELFTAATLAKTTLPNTAQLYLSLKYLGRPHTNLQDITSGNQNDLPISFNNKLTMTPISKNKVMCQNGGSKQHEITSIDYDKKHISGLVKYDHCNDTVSIHGTKKIEYTLNDQNQLSSYSESYLSDFYIANISYAAGSQINYNHLHYTNQVLDKYNTVYTLKITINESTEKYILGFKDLAVAYDISSNALTFSPTKGKIYIKDASEYFEVNTARSTDSSPIKLAQGKYLSSGNISFMGAEDKSFVVQSTKENLLSFLITDKQEQTALSW